MSVTQNTKRFQVITSTIVKNVKMNTAKLSFTKMCFKKFVKILLGLKSLLRDKIEEMCCNEKLSVEEIIYFIYKRLRQLLKLDYICLP